MKMRDHVTIVSLLRFGFNALGLLVAALVFLAVVGGGLISGDPVAMRVTLIVGTAAGLFMALLSVAGLIVSIGLFKRWSWARWLALILAVFDLTLVPLGTLYGIYAIWVLMQAETAQMFS